MLDPGTGSGMWFLKSLDPRSEIHNPRLQKNVHSNIDNTVCPRNLDPIYVVTHYINCKYIVNLNHKIKSDKLLKKVW